MTDCYIDFETRSRCSLKDCGAWVYARHPSTEIMHMAYAVEDGEPEIWVPGCGMPMALLNVLMDRDCRVWAHGAFFERAIWHHIMIPKHNMPRIPLENWRDSMAAAAKAGWPRPLGKGAVSMKLAEQEDDEGSSAMKKLTSPAAKTGEFLVDLALEELSMRYCAQDVRVSRAIRHKAGELDASEQAVWFLDQRINTRGVKVDIPLVEDALFVVKEAERRIIGELPTLTDGAITKPGQVARIAKFCDLPNTKEETVSKTLAGEDCTDNQRRVLEIRQELGKSSVAKLAAALASADPDDHRIRGMLQYHGAATGRWAGRLFQPQNLPRPVMKVDYRQLVEAIRHRDVDYLTMMYGSATHAVSDVLRNLLIAGPGLELVCNDFSSIEARLVAWAAGEEWKVDAFRRGEDIYCLTASKILGYNVVKGDPGRQVGKTCELAAGYQGWVGAWRQFDSATPLEDAERYLGAWRDEHKGVVNLWASMERSALHAVATPGRVFEAGPFAFKVIGDGLHLRLPTGRHIVYRHGQIHETIRHGKDQLSLLYWGYKEGRWQAIDAYGGMFFGHAIQGTARDIMVNGMHACEAQDMHVILTVHDELILEVPEGHGNSSEVEQLLVQPVKGCEGVPLNAGGWVGDRYHKED